MRKTIYQRIYADLIGKIKQGSYKAGELLPSTRELAKLHRCHRFTVMNVCQDLMAEGWIDSQPRSRYMLSKKTPVMGSSKTPLRKPKRDLSKNARALPDVDLEQTRYRIEFWGGQPDLRLFPKDEFRRVLSAGLKRIKPDQLGYGLPRGLDSCLKEVSDYLRKSRSILNKEFIITNGSQEALMLAAQAFIKPGDKIAVEKKGYPPAWRLFESLGALLIPIAVDEEGLSTDDLQDKLRQHSIKLIYVTPLHQYPTTVTLSPRRRQRLIQLAEQKLIPILEDDYDHEYHFSGPPPAPLSAETDLGIYICSFSKVLFPGARLGVLGCDPKLLKHFSYQKHLTSRQTDSLTQVGLAAWIRDGGFERHLRRMCRIYESRHLLMQQELEKIRSTCNIDWQTPNGGMSIWVNCRQDTKKVADSAKRKGIFFQHESTMDYQATVGTHLRIGFAGVNETEIKEGLTTLKSILKPNVSSLD